MKTNNLLQRSLMALVALLGCITASAQEAYVIKSTDNTTLTFYYDDLKSTRVGTPYELNGTGSDPAWYLDGSNTSITKVVFDASFADARPTNTSQWFFNMKKLTSITNLEYLNTSEVTDMRMMFSSCEKLTSLDVSHFNTANVTNMSSMFFACRMTSLDVSNFNTAKVEYMAYMFADCYNLEILDLSNFDTSNVKNMAWMFRSCQNLKTLDVSSFNTENVTDMNYMFCQCKNLTSLDLSWFNAAKVTDMESMFCECFNLTSLDLFNFSTANVVNMYNMFYRCEKLVSLDLRGFKTANVTNMGHMFTGCINLTTIYVSSNNWSVANVTESTNMFGACPSLVGGMGTVYTGNFEGADYAHIDGGPSNPGYLTQAPTLDVYAIFDNESRTMTHYYDEKIEERRATLATGERIIEGQGYDSFYWGDEGEDLDPVKVVFDATYARYDASWSNGQIDGYFKYFSSLEIIEGLEYLNMNGVTDLSYLFADCTALTTLDLTRLDTRNITNMQGMFSGCTSLKTIYVSEKWNTDKVTISAKMFEDCNQLVGGQGTTFDAGHIDKEYARLDGGTDSPGYFTGPVPYAVITSDFTLTFYNDGQKDARQGISYDLNEGENAPDWAEVRHAVKSVVFDRSFKTARPTTTFLWFEGMSRLESVTNLQYLNTSEVTNMSWMFRGCSALENLDLSSFNTANVTNMHFMFENCICLKSLNISSFDTRKVTDMAGMFEGCSELKTIYIGPKWNTEQVSSSENMFYNCTSIVGRQGTTYDANHIDAEYAHPDGGESNPGYMTATVFWYEFYVGGVIVNDWNEENIEGDNIRGKVSFDPTKRELTLNNATIDCTNANGILMYYKYVFDDITIKLIGDNRLENVSAYSPFPIDLQCNTTFTGDGKLTIDGEGVSIRMSAAKDLIIDGGCTIKGREIKSSNDAAKLTVKGANTEVNLTKGISGFASITLEEGITYVKPEGGSYDTTNKYVVDSEGNQVTDGVIIKNPPYAVYDSSTQTLTFYHDGKRATHNGETVYYLNEGSNNPDWYVDGNYENVTTVVFDPSFADVRPTTTYAWFKDMGNLTSITGMEYLNTSEVTTMRRMFYNCSSLTELDLSHLNTANVTDMAYMFYNCEGLTSLDVRNFNTSNVTDMNSMFEYCSSLTSLNVSHFNTAGVTNMSAMFHTCSSLTSLDLSHFNTTNVTDMQVMFVDCRSLTGLDLSSFNTANVTDMMSMFWECSSLTKLDLSSFNTANVTNMKNLFIYCSNLKTIYVSDKWSMESIVSGNSTNMFLNCTSLVGGEGTQYSAYHIHEGYAHIDGGADNPGYFTEKPALIPGDANDDGVVSIADVTAVVGHILGQPVGYFNTKAADVNHSGSVTIADAKIIVEVLLGNIDLEIFMRKTEELQNRMEACEDFYEQAKEYLESIDSGHAQTTLWQMAREIEAMMAEVQKQLENVSSEYEAEECLKNMHELQDQIEILNAEINELQKDA